MSELKLQPDELELLASYEKDEWQSAKNIKRAERTIPYLPRAPRSERISG